MNKMLSLGILLKAKDSLSPKLAGANQTLSKFDAKVKKIGTGMLKIGAGSAAIGTATLAPLKKFYGDYTQIAKSQGELESLGIGAKGIGIITKEAKSFTNQFARISAPQFLTAAYDIKSGISSLSDEGVAKMTRFSSTTAQATKASGEEMSKLFALGYGIFGKDFKSDFSFGEKFSAAIATTVQAFRTDGADISQGLSNIGAGAKSMGISLEEELSVLGGLKGSFSTAAEAGTAYRAFLDGVGKAQKDLGLKFTDSKGHLLPMVKILEKIKGKYKDLKKLKVKDTIKDAFGSGDAYKLIAGLIDKTDDFSKAQSNLRRNMDKGIEVTEKMAKTMNKGYGIELMTNRITNLTSSIGARLEPVISSVTTKIGNTAIKVNKWMNENKELSTTITQVVAIGGTALIGFGALSIGIGLALKTLSFLTMGFKVFAPVLLGTKLVFGGLISAFTLLSGPIYAIGTAIAFVGKTMLLSPIGLFAIAMGTAVYTIVKYWEPIKGFFTNLWKQIGRGFKMGLAGLKEQWKRTIAIFSFDKIKNKMSGISTKVKGWFGVKTELKKTQQIEKNINLKPIEAKRLSTVNTTDMKRVSSMKQEVKINKIEINNPSSTVDVEKGVAAGIKTKATSLNDEEF